MIRHTGARKLRKNRCAHLSGMTGFKEDEDKHDELHLCAKLTYKIAAAAAAAAAKISARRRHGKKKIKIFTKTWKTKKLQKTSKKSIKTSILEELGINGRDHQILREKLPI